MFRGTARQLVETMGAAYWARDFGRMARLFVFPLPVYVDGTVATYGDDVDFTAGLAELRDSLDALQVVGLATDLVAETPCRGGSFRALVRWRYAMGPGRAERTSHMMCYCLRPFGPRAREVQVAMLEYRDTAFGPGPYAAQAERVRARAARRRDHG